MRAGTAVVLALDGGAATEGRRKENGIGPTGLGFAIGKGEGRRIIVGLEGFQITFGCDANGKEIQRLL